MWVDSLTIGLTDVLQVPLAASVELGVTTTAGTSRYGPYAWGPQPKVSVIQDSVHAISITVAHDDYAPTRLNIDLRDNAVAWDNRSCDVKRQGSDLAVTITVVRARQAPGTTIPDELAQRVANGPWDSRNLSAGIDVATLQDGIWIDPGDAAHRYLGLPDALESLTIRTLVDRNGSMLASADAQDWRRFQTTDTQLALKDKGAFLWLEYGSVASARPKPKFLVGVWAPSPPRTPLTNVDVIVNLGHSPTAWGIPAVRSSSLAPYPYTVHTESWPRGWPQAYVNMGLPYFFQTTAFAFFFAAQLAASGRTPLLIQPIMPAVFDDAAFMFQPLNSHAGMHRLLLEVVQFLHQEGYGWSPSKYPRAWNGSSARPAWADPPPEEFRITTARARPSLRNVAIAGHSSGITWLSPLLATTDIINKQAFPPTLYGASAQQFGDAWTEVWDLDLTFAADTGANSRALRDGYQSSLLRWLGGRDGRKLRMYHSEQTCSQLSATLPIVFSPNNKQIAWPKSPISRASTVDASQRAEDWRSTDGRAVAGFFSDKYVSSPSAIAALPDFPHPAPGGSKPYWWRLHQFAMILGFGHACTLLPSP